MIVLEFFEMQRAPVVWVHGGLFPCGTQAESGNDLQQKHLLALHVALWLRTSTLGTPVVSSRS